MSASAAPQKKAEEGRSTFQVLGLNKIYKTGDVEVHALGGLEFELYPSELVVLLGPSVGDKSTLLNILDGLDKPSTGQVFFDHAELTSGDKCRHG
jgi:putative ABC transport system ATP-binding protein